METYTNHYYFESKEKRDEIRKILTEELSDIGEMKALSHNYSEEKLDSTASYNMYMKVTWETYTSGSDTYGKITQVSGGYDQKDYTVKVVSQYVAMGQLRGADSQNKFSYPTTKTWSYSPNFSYQKISNMVGSCMGGAYYTLEIKRNAGSWTTEIDYKTWDTGTVSLADFLSGR